MTDCFAELIAYVAYFLKARDKENTSFDQFKSETLRLLAKSDDFVKTGQVQADEFDQARFAVCAWIDEAILTSNWSGKMAWQKEQLQRLYYNTTEAGQEFYERLNMLGMQQADVREIYYLCLALGFKGRYCNQGDEFLLEQLMTSNLKILTGSAMGLAGLERTELFPESYPHEVGQQLEGKRGFQFTPFFFAMVGGPIALLLTLFIIYSFILNNIGDSFVGKGL